MTDGQSEALREVAEDTEQLGPEIVDLTDEALDRRFLDAIEKDD